MSKDMHIVWISNLVLFFLDMNVNYLTARVQAPSGGTTDAQIIETEDSNYSIRFVPRVSEMKNYYDGI